MGLRFRWIVVGLVAAVPLVVAPAASSAGDEGQIVVWSNAGCSGGSGYMTETLAGAATDCRPFDSFTGEFAVAADETIVSSGEAGLGDTAPVTLIRRDGQLLTLDTSPYDLDPAISPDGSKVAFARYEPPYNPLDGPTDIFVVNSDGTGLKEIASGAGVNQLTAPTFSPDGSTIAYSCAPALATSTAWSKKCGPLPDGSDANQVVFLMNADGSDKRAILLEGTQSLSWSPDGQWITTGGEAPCTCANGNTHNGQVFVYHTDGSDLFNVDDPSRQVTHETDYVGAVLPQFSADGTQLVYLKTLDDSGAQGNFPYAINRDRTNRHELTLSPEGAQWGVLVPASGGGGPPPTVDAMRITVPSLHKLGYRAAKRRLQHAHLRIGKVRRHYSSRLPRNHVLAQYPRAGAHAHRSTKQGPPINLVLSRGPKHS
jgi:PASTA domain/WD40-like Beta Propeller Repeat